MAVKKREVKLAIGACIGMFLTYTALTTFFPAYLEETRGFSAGQASNITGIIPLAGLIGSFLCGFGTGAIGKRKPFMWPMMVLMLVGTFGAITGSSMMILYISVFAVGFGCNAFLPVLYTYFMDLEGATPQMVASAMALTIGTSLILNFFNSMLFNFFLSRVGMTGAFLVYCVILPTSGS